MAQFEEENFPRGGTVIRKRPAQETEDNIFDIKEANPKRPKKSKQKEQTHVNEDAFQSALNIHGTLSYNKLQTGMLILGCVRHITNFSLEVELPGFCFATVNITDISDPFTKQLNKLLETNDPDSDNILRRIFSVGEFLLVKIASVEVRDKGTHVEASINPRDIYSDHNYSSFKKEMLIWATIKSEADHGYEVTLGIKNCRAFLPFKNVTDKTKCVIGKPLWCVVHKADTTESSSILRVSAKEEHLKNKSYSIENLHNVIPGMKVDFITEKITTHGIQGRISEHFMGYIDESYLSKPLKKLSDYNEGKLLTAYVLFVEPASKIIHLSLRNLDSQEEIFHVVGDIVPAEVFSKSSHGMFFVLPNKQKGFVTNKRLINTLGKKDTTDINEAIKSKFSIGSTHQVRIMDYNYISKTYICTAEFSVLKESTFTCKDLIVGQFVKITIISVKEEGLVVKSGHIRGFVPNLHISSTEYTSNTKKKYKPGQQSDARVLSVENDKVLFTMKPALVKDDKCLTKIEDAEVGTKYPGLVAKISEKGILVVFYGNVKGWISQKGMYDESTDPTNLYFLGQVVSVYIWKVKGAFLYLSLFRPQLKSALPNVGGRYCGIVVSIGQDGINIQIENSKRRGFVPNNHLSCSISLGGALKTLFQIGDRIPDLMYVGGVEPQIFSRREALAMKTKQVLKLENLHIGDLIRCSYQSNVDSGILVVPLIQDFTNSVLIPTEKIFKGQTLPDFVQYQCLIARVEEIEPKKKTVNLTLCLNDAFQVSVEDVMTLFTQYISEIHYLKQNGRKQNWNICKFNIGDQVVCKIEKIGTKGGCMATLPNDVKAITVPSLCPKHIKVGDQIKGTVIGHDFNNQFVDICLRSDISGKINSLQDGNMDSSIHFGMAETLLTKDDYTVVLLKNPQAKKQLIYLPAKLHENDFKGCAPYYENRKFKVCICGKIKSYLIGMNKKLFLKLDKPAHESFTLRNISKARKIIKSEESMPRRIKKSVVESEEETCLETSSESEHEVDMDEVDQDGKSSESECEVDQDDKYEEVEAEKDHKHSSTTTTLSVALPGILSYFNPAKRQNKIDDVSSEDEETGPKEKRKKKLTPAERTEMLRQNEERISKIERELANSTSIKQPESAEQFDRLLVANPNSSQLWTKYISFHIAATEIEKAKAVARRALDTIDMALPQEKFNIWIVLLNLETMFGTKDSFEAVLKEALQFNDSLQIYLRVVQIFLDNGKYSEMEEQIQKVRSKHKQDPTMWLEIAKAYYQIKNFEKARNCKDSALKSITDKKIQMDLIERFAIMEFQYGEEDQGCAIFEAILTSNPKKVNVWVKFVDQLIKKGRIDQARQILERSLSLQLPLKSMKILFSKFRNFEEVHGNQETLEAVKQRAQQYVASFEK